MGNTAVVIGALYAGCQGFFGYPITPASEVSHGAAELFPRLGREFLQAESETAAINMIYGAAATGSRAMTASSGPGMSLMQEGLSFLAAAELPCVVVDIMRAGPGLGNIGPEQSDYNQAVNGGGHGDYHNLVVAPNSVQEMCDFTIWAFELAFRYRTPAIVLADGVLGQMMENLRLPETPLRPEVDTSWAVAGTPETRPNLITSIYLDFDALEKRNMALLEKYARIERSEAKAETYLTDDAELVLVAYGISSRIARTAVDACRRAGQRVGLFRPLTLYPFPSAQLQALAGDRARLFLCVEMSNGQLAQNVTLAIRFQRPVEVVFRLGGNLPQAEDVVARARQMLDGHTAAG
jgi:2-oxoisovalerate ferredoxin oxidoreductase alpha subunit